MTSREDPPKVNHAGHLHRAAPQAQCELHLALVSVHESGAAEYLDPGRYAREDRYQADDVDERVRARNRAPVCGLDSGLTKTKRPSSRR